MLFFLKLDCGYWGYVHHQYIKFGGISPSRFAKILPNSSYMLWGVKIMTGKFLAHFNIFKKYFVLFSKNIFHDEFNRQK